LITTSSNSLHRRTDSEAGPAGDQIAVESPGVGGVRGRRGFQLTDRDLVLLKWIGGSSTAFGATSSPSSWPSTPTTRRSRPPVRVRPYPPEPLAAVACESGSGQLAGLVPDRVRYRRPAGARISRPNSAASAGSNVRF